MNQIKELFGQTAIYGTGIVLPRFLNFVVLTPFFTRVFKNTNDYGIITELYAYVIFLIVILTYGMETGYFRYASDKKNKDDVYTSVITSVFTTSLIFLIIVFIAIRPISSGLGYENHQQYIKWLSLIVAIDAFTAIPFARIRLLNKPRKYALIRILEVSVNIGLNIFFLKYCNDNYQNIPWINKIYNPEIWVGYVLISNLIASILKLILLSDEILAFYKGKFNLNLLKVILKYSFPLLIAGMAGAINEALDRALLKHLLDPMNDPMGQLGIYGANFKIAVLMTLYVQMFRYAAEPFFFSKSKQKDAKTLYADVLKFFLIPGFIIFLGVIFYIDLFKLFIGKNYREGLEIVPIVLMANLVMGIFFNLSIWYKLTDKTKVGAILVLTGALITVIINIAFVPKYGYHASAWGHLICYSVMVVLSYLWSRKNYKIPYDFRRIILYFIIVSAFYVINQYFTNNDLKAINILRPLMLIIVIIIFYLGEKKTFIRYSKSN